MLCDIPVEPARHRNVMLFELIRVFESFDHKEGRAEYHRQNQKNNLVTTASHLREKDRKRHCQTADDKNSGIRRAQINIQTVAGDREGSGIKMAIEEIRQEDTTEEHN